MWRLFWRCGGWGLGVGEVESFEDFFGGWEDCDESGRV